MIHALVEFPLSCAHIDVISVCSILDLCAFIILGPIGSQVVIEVAFWLFEK